MIDLEFAGLCLGSVVGGFFLAVAILIVVEQHRNG